MGGGLCVVGCGAGSFEREEEMDATFVNDLEGSDCFGSVLDEDLKMLWPPKLIRLGKLVDLL